MASFHFLEIPILKLLSNACISYGKCVADSGKFAFPFPHRPTLICYPLGPNFFLLNGPPNEHTTYPKKYPKMKEEKVLLIPPHLQSQLAHYFSVWRFLQGISNIMNDHWSRI